MLTAQETFLHVDAYAVTPLTDLPLLYDPEHCYPYASYGDTSATPTSRAMRFLQLENVHLRVLVAPELGGRVWSLFDKRIGREILYNNPVVKPTRILPVWAYISGGIEFNFPISHAPTSAFSVGSAYGVGGDYAWIQVGEREARTGMHWTVELGLKAGVPILFQRTLLRNATSEDHPWMFWSNCAVRSTVRTEFVYPSGPVLMHGDRVETIDWPGRDMNWERHIDRMLGFFWKEGQGTGFGAFHHDQGHGLLHVADPRAVPGKKLWSYGIGRHRRWGILTADDGSSYAEIQSGPLVDQSQKPLLASGSERHFEEYWIPVHNRLAMDAPAVPAHLLPPMRQADLGLLHSPYQLEWERFIAGDGRLPRTNVPPGLNVEGALRREVDRNNPKAREQLGVYLAFKKRPDEARAILSGLASPSAARVLGLVLWKGLNRPTEAVEHLSRGPLHDLMAVVELDAIYKELGLTAERQKLLNGVRAMDGATGPQRRLLERQADLAIECGNPEKSIGILRSIAWPLEHQRYVRTELWQRAQGMLGNADAPVPEELGEDDLAPFGAYWSD